MFYNGCLDDYLNDGCSECRDLLLIGGYGCFSLFPHLSQIFPGPQLHLYLWIMTQWAWFGILIDIGIALMLAWEVDTSGVATIITYGTATLADFRLPYCSHVTHHWTPIFCRSWAGLQIFQGLSWLAKQSHNCLATWSCANVVYSIFLEVSERWPIPTAYIDLNLLVYAEFAFVWPI